MVSRGFPPGGKVVGLVGEGRGVSHEGAATRPREKAHEAGADARGHARGGRPSEVPHLCAEGGRRNGFFHSGEVFR